MFRYVRQILLKETDATGVLFFTEQLNLALEALESFFLSRGFTIKQMIEQEGFAMPIVHAESDFFLPIKVGDEVTVELICEKVGTSSFTLSTVFKDQEKKNVGTAQIVHVCISQKTGKSMPIPSEVLAHLRKLCIV